MLTEFNSHNLINYLGIYINSYIFISLYILLITILYVIYVCLLGGSSSQISKIGKIVQCVFK